MAEHESPAVRATRSLRALAETDPVAAPLARLQIEVLRFAVDAAWEAALPALDGRELPPGAPALYGQTLSVSGERARALLGQLAEVASRAGSERAAAVRKAMERARLDPLGLVESSINQDSPRLETLAREAGVDPAMLATLAQLAVQPLLHACRRHAASLTASPWTAGYCPLCGAWPALSESRSVERQRWLRCGRCGTGWLSPHRLCCFCSNQDHRTLGYLAAEKEREARRADTCDVCRGYLKSIASNVPLEPEEVAVLDLTTLELDAAAIDRGYLRPERPGYSPGARIVGSKD